MDVNEEKETILIVDDEPDILNLLSEATERWGYQAVTARDGEEGLNKIENVPVDLLLTDFRMPKANGKVLVEKIKKISPDTSVIVFTGYSSVDGAVDLIKAGADEYLTKPVDLAKLKTTIAGLLKEKRAAGRNTILNSINWGLILSIPIWLILGIILIRSL